MNLRKRIFALLMAFIMVLTYMPALAFADTVPSDADGSGEAAVSDESVTEPAAEDQNVEEPAPPADDTADQAEATEVAPSAAEEVTEVETVPEEPAASDPEEQKSQDGLKMSVSQISQNYTGNADLAESDDLLMQFLEKEVAGETGKPAGSKMLKARRATRGSSLEGNDRVVYDALVPKIKAIAGGTTSSTVMVFPASLIVGDDFELTLDELNSFAKEGSEIDTIVDPDTGKENPAAGALISEAIIDFNINKVINALLSDYPYEFYWYDKTYQDDSTTGVTASVKDYSYTAYQDRIEIDKAAGYSFSFIVSKDYSADETTGTTAVDTSKTGAAASFASNAGDIVGANADKTDLDKLTAYKDAICDATSYNDAAADDATKPPYGDPWQMIWVFDGDDTTNVVCEGYSKAFQFLCDATTFDSVRIECDTATGEMDGGTGAGGHMWNILRMDDGNNYMADITNSDTDTVGEDGSLFLKGYTSGDVNNGYIFEASGKNISYVYDSDAKNTFTTDELTLSKTDYGKSEVITDNIPTAIELTLAPDNYGNAREIEAYADADYLDNFPQAGDTIKVTYGSGDNPIVKDYVFDAYEWAFIDENGENLESNGTGYSLEYKYGRNGIGFVADKDGYDTLTINYSRGNSSVSADLPVKIIESTATGFTYNQAEPFVLYADSEGNLQDIDRNDFVQLGDTMSVDWEYHYGDETVTDHGDYTAEFKNNREEYGVYVCEDGSARTNPRMVTDMSGWEAGQTYDAELSYEGVRAPIKVKVEEFPYTSMEFEPAAFITLMSNVLKATAEDGSVYFDLNKRSMTNRFFLNGDQLTLKGSGNSAVYTFNNGGFYDSEGKLLPFSNQLFAGVKKGKAKIGENDAVVNYLFLDSDTFKVDITEGGDESFVINSDGMQIDAYRTADGIAYAASYDGDSYIVIGYNGKDSEMVVPAEINGMPVTEFNINPYDPVEGDTDYSNVTGIDFSNNENLSYMRVSRLNGFSNLETLSNLDNNDYKIVDNALYENDNEEGLSLVYYPGKCPAETLTLAPDAVRISYNALGDNSYLKKIALSQGISSLDSDTLSGLSSLEEVEFTAAEAPASADDFVGLKQVYLANPDLVISYPEGGTGYEEFINDIKNIGYGPMPDDADIVQLEEGPNSFNLAENEVKTVAFTVENPAEYNITVSTDDNVPVDVCSLELDEATYYERFSGQTMCSFYESVYDYEAPKTMYYQVRATDGSAAKVYFKIEKNASPEVNISNISVDKTTIGKKEENTVSFHVAAPEDVYISSVYCQFMSDKGDSEFADFNVDYETNVSETDASFTVAPSTYGLWELKQISVAFREGRNTYVYDISEQGVAYDPFGNNCYTDMSRSEFSVVADPDDPEDTQAPVITGPYTAGKKSITLDQDASISFGVSDDIELSKVIVELYNTNGGYPQFEVKSFTEDNYQDGILTATGHLWDTGDYSIYCIRAYDSSYNYAVMFNSKCPNVDDEYYSGQREDMSSADFTVTEAPDHEHNANNHFDSVDATCTEQGNIEYYQCDICGRYFSDADAQNELTEGEVFIPAKGHVIITQEGTPATCEEPGMTEGSYCSVCGTVLAEQEEIPALGHDWEGPEYEWTENDTKCAALSVCKNNASHTQTETVDVTEEITQPATCETAGIKTLTATFENDFFETQTKTVGIPATGHSWNEGETTAEGTVYTCTVCGETKTEGGAHEHTPGEAVHENAVDPTCEEEGSYDVVVYCTECGEELSRETVTDPATGHSPGEAVEENVTEATCGEDGSYEEVVYCQSCGEEISRETKTIQATGEHAWDEGEVTTPATTESEGVRTYTCEVCGKTREESIPKVDPNAKLYDWHIAGDMDAGVLERTIAVEGIGGYNGSGEYFEIEPIDDEVDPLDIYEKTLTFSSSDTSIATVKRSSDTSNACEVTYQHKTGTAVITASYNGKTVSELKIIIKNGIKIDKSKLSIPFAESYESPGYDFFPNVEVSFDGKVLKPTVDYQIWIQDIEGKESDSVARFFPLGEYYSEDAPFEYTVHVVAAPKYGEPVSARFELGEGNNPLWGYTDSTSVSNIFEPGNKIIVSYEGGDFESVEYICVRQQDGEDGTSVDFYPNGDVTKTSFMIYPMEDSIIVGDGSSGLKAGNNNAKVKITFAQDDDELSHDIWADITVKGVSEEHEHEAGEPVIENKAEATCSEAGSYDEVVYCIFCQEELSRETKTIPIDPDAHKWTFTGFTWNGEAAVANYECAYNGEHKDTVAAKVETKTIPPTCEAAGKIVHTAKVDADNSLDGEAHEDSKEAAGDPATGHDWEFTGFAWIDDSAAATYKCRNNAEETRNVTATVSSETTAPTCETDGKITYTALVAAGDSLDGGSHSDIKEEAGEKATGHKWTEPVYEWSEDFASVTASHTCQNSWHEGEKTVTETVDAAGEVVEAPTLEKEGKMLYTSAEFKGSSFKVQTKEKTLPKQTLDEAIAEADGKATNAAAEADAADSASAGSTDMTAAEEAQRAAQEAVNLATVAEAAAQSAYEDAKSALDSLPEDATDEVKAAAQNNLEVAANNLATAKKIKAAASSAKSTAKKAAAKVASNKAAAANTSAQNAGTSAQAEAYRKQAEAAAKEAESLANEAKESAKEADDAVKSLNDLAEENADNAAVAEAFSNAADAAGESASSANEAAGNADKSSSSAKDSEAKAKAAVADKANKENQARIAAAARAAAAARDGVYDPSIPKVKVSNPAAKKSNITAKWKKLTKKQLKKSKATHYEIWVSANPTFPAGPETKEKIVKKSKAKVKVSGLKKKTKYYVRVRAIKYVGGVKHVGAWKQKTIKTKKK